MDWQLVASYFTVKSTDIFYSGFFTFPYFILFFSVFIYFHFQFHSHCFIRWILITAYPFAMFTILFETKKGGRARNICIYYRNSYLHVILWFLECIKFLDELDRMTNCNSVEPGTN